MITSAPTVCAAMLAPASVVATICTPPVAQDCVGIICTARLAAASVADVAPVVVNDGRFEYDGTTTAYRRSSSYSSCTSFTFLNSLSNHDEYDE